MTEMLLSGASLDSVGALPSTPLFFFKPDPQVGRPRFEARMPKSWSVYCTMSRMLGSDQAKRGNPLVGLHQLAAAVHDLQLLLVLGHRGDARIQRSCVVSGLSLRTCP